MRTCAVEILGPQIGKKQVPRPIKKIFMHEMGPRYMKRNIKKIQIHCAPEQSRYSDLRLARKGSHTHPCSPLTTSLQVLRCATYVKRDLQISKETTEETSTRDHKKNHEKRLQKRPVGETTHDTSKRDFKRDL